ncbi:hypothetical protein BDV3_005317 [Batrachochytrium dendrobatidis]
MKGESMIWRSPRCTADATLVNQVQSITKYKLTWVLPHGTQYYGHVSKWLASRQLSHEARIDSSQIQVCSTRSYETPTRIKKHTVVMFIHILLLYTWLFQIIGAFPLQKLPPQHLSSPSIEGVHHGHANHAVTLQYYHPEAHRVLGQVMIDPTVADGSQLTLWLRVNKRQRLRIKWEGISWQLLGTTVNDSSPEAIYAFEGPWPLSQSSLPQPTHATEDNYPDLSENDHGIEEDDDETPIHIDKVHPRWFYVSAGDKNVDKNHNRLFVLESSYGLLVPSTDINGIPPLTHSSSPKPTFLPTFQPTLSPISQPTSNGPEPSHGTLPQTVPSHLPDRMPSVLLRPSIQRNGGSHDSSDSGVGVQGPTSGGSNPDTGSSGSPPKRKPFTSDPNSSGGDGSAGANDQSSSSYNGPSWLFPTVVGAGVVAVLTLSMAVFRRYHSSSASTIDPTLSHYQGRGYITTSYRSSGTSASFERSATSKQPVSMGLSETLERSVGSVETDIDQSSLSSSNMASYMRFSASTKEAFVSPSSHSSAESTGDNGWNWGASRLTTHI